MRIKRRSAVIIPMRRCGIMNQLLKRIRSVLNISLKDFFLLNAGTLLVAAGVYFFKFPNNFSTGGVSGISIILGHFFPQLSSGSYVWIINMVLLLLGFILIGGSFGAKTVYSSILFSAAVWGLERICPLSAPMTSQPFLELIFSVMLPAIGSAILFDIGASTGGTDITAMILKKYSSLDIGKALLCVDALITVAACFVFGMETGLFSILGLAAKALMVDSFIESFHICKYFNIVTTKPDEICEYITRTLNRSATVLEAKGYYSKENRTLLLTVMTRPQAVQLNRFLKANDPGAFVTISNISTIIGKGFRSSM